MSLENTLERIAVALEEFVQEQRLHNHAWKQYAEQLRGIPLDAPTTQAPAASSPAPATLFPAAVPMGGPPVGGPPTTGPAMAAPGAGVPSPTTGPAPGAPGPTAPATSAPVPTQTPQTPVQGVPTLDDIKALANDFHRAHPDKAAEFVQVLAGKNVTKLSELPPASYPEIHGKLKEMMGGA